MNTTRSHRLLAAATGAALFAVLFCGCQSTRYGSANPRNIFAKWQRPTHRTSEPEVPPEPNAEQRADFQMTVARSFEKKGFTKQALKMYQGVVEKDDRRADAYHRMAVLYDKRGECEQSDKHYREALEREPDNAQMHCDYGYSCYLQQRLSDAEKHLRKATELDPEMETAHNNLGLLLARTDRSRDALGEFARAGCTEATARTNLAFVLLLDEKWEPAREQFELALAADPTSRSANEGLQTLRSLSDRRGQKVSPVTRTVTDNEAVPASYFSPRQPVRPGRDHVGGVFQKPSRQSQ